MFEKLSLPHSKKGKTGYSTAIEVLNKLKDKHPIVNKIIEYRALMKLYTTYIDFKILSTAGLDNSEKLEMIAPGEKFIKDSLTPNKLLKSVPIALKPDAV